MTKSYQAYIDTVNYDVPCKTNTCLRLTWQDVTQWTHNIGYANDWDKPQHTLSKWTFEHSSRLNKSL